jgi:hypothetical protein
VAEVRRARETARAREVFAAESPDPKADRFDEPEIDPRPDGADILIPGVPVQ